MARPLGARTIRAPGLGECVEGEDAGTRRRVERRDASAKGSMAATCDDAKLPYTG